jgi:hypothetical protein
MLNRRLVWVAEEDGKIHGMLIAFAGHDFFFPVRLVGTPGEGWLKGLLWKAFRDAQERGYHFFVTVLDKHDGKVAKKLARLALRRGAILDADGWMAGQIADMFNVSRQKNSEDESVAC